MATLIGIAIGATAFTFATGLAALMEIVSIGSLFMSQEIDIGENSPSYAFGPLQNTKTQKLPIPIIYGGPVKVAGNVFYERFLDAEKTRVYRHIGISEGPVESIYDVYANEFNIDDPFNGRAVTYQWRQWETYYVESGDNGPPQPQRRLVWKNCSKSQYLSQTDENMRRILDTDGKTVITMPITECSASVYLNTTSTTRDSRDPSGRRPYPNDLAFVAVTLKAQENLNGNPVITSMVKGMKVWTPTGTKFSRNPAWIIRDFLTNTRYGLGIPSAKLDDASFLAAANYCDGLIEGLPRFSLDYIIDTQKSAIDILSEMLSCCRGYVLHREKIGLYIDMPVSTYYKKVGLDQIVEGSFSWWQSADEDILNRVVIEWVDPAQSYELTTTVFEDVADINARGVFERSFTLRGITNSAQAGRMGAYLLDSSQGVRNFCTFNLSLKDADVEAGDVIALTHDLPGWVDKWFRVVAVTDNDSTDDLITVSCSEYIAEIYNDRALDVPERINTQLDDPTNPPNVARVALTEDGYKLRDGTHVASVFATWSPVDGASRYRVSYSYNGGAYTYWQDVPQGTAPSCEIINVRIGNTITVKVETMNSLGFSSTGTVSTPYYIKGIDSPPPDITRFTAAQNGSHITFSGVTPTNIDYNRVEIRRGGTSWETAKAYAVVRTFPATVEGLWDGTHVFWAKNVDNGGNYSVNAVSAICNISGMQTYKNIVLNRNDISDTTGMTLDGLYLSKQGYFVAESRLRYMDLPDTYQELLIEHYGAAQDYTELTSDVIDTYKVGSTGILYDFVWQVLFGVAPTYGDIGERIYGEYPTDTYGRITMPAIETIDIRFSDDDVTWSDWVPYLSGEYQFRYIQYRLKLRYTSTTAHVEITKLQQYYDVPDITISEVVSVPSGGLTVNFVNDYDKDFYATPTEVITTVIGGAGNVFPDVTGLSEAGLTLKCYNRTGAAVSGQVQLVVKGY